MLHVYYLDSIESKIALQSGHRETGNYFLPPNKSINICNINDSKLFSLKNRFFFILKKL